MLTIEQIRRIAHQTGARDIDKVETDVILTYLLQLFHDKGITEHVAFKGGTMLRKMIFGSRGRLSTDLDFTRRTDIGDEGLMEMMLDAVGQSYHGLSFRFDRDKDWYFTDNSLAANPVCTHAGNEKGVNVRLEVSLREPATGEAMSELMLDGAAHRVDLAPFAPGRLPPLDPTRGVVGCANAPAPVSIATRTLRRVCPRGSRIAGPRGQNRPALSRVGSRCKRSPVAAHRR
jgi:hypothetical protein